MDISALSTSNDARWRTELVELEDREDDDEGEEEELLDNATEEDEYSVDEDGEEEEVLLTPNSTFTQPGPSVQLSVASTSTPPLASR